MVAHLFLLDGLTFETWRHYLIGACNDIVLVGANEVVLTEEELVQ